MAATLVTPVVPPARVTEIGGVNATYSYSVLGATPYATCQDLVALRGSATKTVKVLRVEVSGFITTAAGIAATLKLHSVANTGGTSTTPTPAQHNSNDPAATATVLLYSAAPTTSATAIIVKAFRLLLQPLASPTGTADRYVYDCMDTPGEPITLNGVAQELALNLGGAAVGSGEVIDFSITWSEE